MQEDARSVLGNRTQPLAAPGPTGDPASGEQVEVAAIFDLDRTLIAGFSALAFARDLLRSGRVDLWALQPELAGAFQNVPGRSAGGAPAAPTYDKLMTVLGGLLVGLRESLLVELGERLLESDYRARLHPEAFEAVASHRARGHTLVLASAATAWQAEPIARAFGIEHVLCTRFETLAGRLTGEVAEACWGEGKLRAVRAFARERGLHLDDAYFYSDGIEDLPVLEEVGHPRPTNADDRLAEAAAERGWQVARFDQLAEPGLWELARPLARRRPVPDWRERVQRAVDDQIRMGFRTAHWLRRSMQAARRSSDDEED